MATKADFTEEEWETMHKGLTGAGLLVSAADPGFTDTFGEASALAKHLAAARQSNQNELMRELAQAHGTGFGFASSREKVAAETVDSLRSAVAILTAKAPDDLDAYRQLVLEVAEAVAEAKGGVKPTETDAIDQIKQALGVGAGGDAV
jgi:tellurite resistance protein